tara:strand:- start:60 stop:467 length:408 start_codon:yes stop_codon:yes gene_type:complete
MKNPYRLPEQDILRNAYFDDISIEEAAKIMSLVIDPQMMESAVSRHEKINSLNRILYTGGRRSRTAIEDKIDVARRDSRRMARLFSQGEHNIKAFASGDCTFKSAEIAAKLAIIGRDIESNMFIVEKYIYVNGGR